jgi:hypothetical protein
VFRRPFFLVALVSLSIACGGSAFSKEDAKQFVALSLAGDTELHFAAFTGTFCESDEGRKARLQNGASVPTNAFAFGRMENNAFLKTLVANGFIAVKDQELSPDDAEASHPSCGKRDVCDGCPATSKYYVRTYQLTPKGKDLFLVTPITEGDFLTLYNTPQIGGPFDDIEQQFGDDMPSTISLTLAKKAFDVIQTTTDATKKTARIDYEWYWKPEAKVENTSLKQMIPSGRTRASVMLKQLEDGWHLNRDSERQTQ